MVAIVATGAHLPPTVLPSGAVEARFGLASGTVSGFLGVKERRLAQPEDATSDLAVAAGKQALAGVDLARVGLVILATSTGDHPVPATAPAVAHRLGLACPAFDLQNACSGFVYGLGVAERWIKAGDGSLVLLIGANVLSRRLDWKGEWSTAALFGDGAGAVLLGPDGMADIRAIHLAADGSHPESIQVPAGGSRIPFSAEAAASGQQFLRIQKRPGFLQESVDFLVDVAKRALDRAALKTHDITWFLPHQANARLVAEATKSLGIPVERTLGHLERYGNLSAACLPVLLHEERHRFRAGDKILLATVGAGRAGGAAVLEWR